MTKATLETKLLEARAKLASTQQVLASAELELARRDTEAREHSGALAKMAATHKDSASTQKFLEAENARLRTERTNAADRLLEANSRLTTITQQLTEARIDASLGSAAVELAETLRQEYQVRSEELRTAQQQLAELETSLDELRGRTEGDRALIGNLEDQLLAAMLADEARQSGTPTAATVGPAKVSALMRAFLVAAIGNSLAEQVDIIDDFLVVAPDEPRLLIERGFLLHADARFEAAIVDLRRVSLTELGARGSTALTLSLLEFGHPVEPIELLDDVDWQDLGTANALSSVAARVTPEVCLSVSRYIADRVPPDSAFDWMLASLAAPRPKAFVKETVELMSVAHPARAAPAILDLLSNKRVADFEQWVRDRLRATVIPYGDPAEVALAIRALLKAPDRSVTDLADLLTEAESRLAGEIWVAVSADIMDAIPRKVEPSERLDEIALGGLRAHDDAKRTRDRAHLERVAKCLLRLVPDLSPQIADPVIAAVSPVKVSARGGARVPTTVAEALDLAEAEFKDAVVVLPEARTAAQASQFGNPKTAYKCLTAIGEVAKQYAARSSTSLVEAFKAKGVTFASDISDTAKQQFREDYQRTYLGSKILLGPHVSLGRKTGGDKVLRIYFYVDDDNRRFVIGHVGRHL
jgi:hypothetical protein